MAQNVLVSITTVAYNGEKTIAQAIESVLCQTYSNIEYIIVDGRSTDATVEIAKGYQEAFQERGISYRIISEKDQGMYDALNKGIKLSNGNILGNVNCDDWYEPDAIETVVKKFADANCNVVYGNIKIYKPTGNMIKKAKFTKIATTRHWNHPTMFVTRDLYEKHQYRCLNMYDDLDMLLRLRNEGCRFGTVDKVISNFRFGGMSNEKDFKKMMERIRIRYQVYRRNGYSRLYWLDGAIIELAKYLLA